mmetsp:Transcript_16857/g.26323  ORF Transcript_16857/g.26323 Transcript_16857/m.26323 type:complete len:135 (-) Transcript_16857:1005-1409(-)
MLSIFFLLSLIGAANASLSQCVARDPSTDIYSCIDEHSKTYHHIQPGVLQRISGSAAEQQRIVDVIDRMHDYLAEEVMSRPEYVHVRTKCKNNHDLCAFWTSVGECETNRIFMQDNCAAACQLCLLASTNFAKV